MLGRAAAQDWAETTGVAVVFAHDDGEAVVERGGSDAGGDGNSLLEFSLLIR